MTRDIPEPTIKFNGPILVIETGDTYDTVTSLCLNMRLDYQKVLSYLHGRRKKDVDGYTFEYIHKGAFVSRRRYS